MQTIYPYSIFTSTQSDWIDGDYFESLADAKWDGVQLSGNLFYGCIIYSPTHFANSLFEKSLSINYVLITHNSDGKVENGQSRSDSANALLMPDNVIAWYAQNLTVVNDKIKPIPIGLERNRWHSWKRNLIKNNGKERKGTLVSFNPMTNPSVRLPLINKYGGFKTENGKGFENYIEQLNTHKYVLCPEGNGLDSHRIYEALECGCIPVVDEKTFNPTIYKSLFDKFGVLIIKDLMQWQEQ